MTAEEWLLAAAKRAQRLIAAQISGEYFAPSEEVAAGRELAAAIANYEEEQRRAELVARR